MLDMGFIEDIEMIMSSMPKDKQVLLFSATMTEDVKNLAYDYMDKPKEITVSQDEVVLDLTKQYYISVGRRNKIWALCRILDIDKPKAVIFCQTKNIINTDLKDFTETNQRLGTWIMFAIFICTDCFLRYFQ